MAEDRGRLLVKVVWVSRRSLVRRPSAIGVTREGTVFRFVPGSASRLRRSVMNGNVVVYEVSPQNADVIAELGPEWSDDEVRRLI